jgi:transcriptional regulator with XRE-family HTH domain
MTSPVAGAITSEVMAADRAGAVSFRMTPPDPRPAPRTEPAVGGLLRHWRATRRLSQLELALEAGVSSRHLSYVETGRSRPSREMVLRLADALEIPLRERNGLLVAAGFAPKYFETGMGAPEMAQVRHAVDLILHHQEPYPAFVLDRYWEIQRANEAAPRCTLFLLDHLPAETNMLRLVLRPDGIRPVVMNWEELAGDLVRHLHQQIAATPTDERLRALLAEVLAYPGVPSRWRARDVDASTTPLLTTWFRKDGRDLRFFSTLTMFSTPHDLGLDELRIECNFPADEATATFCRERFSA